VKVLLDTCVSPASKSVLIQAGHDVVWVGDWPRDPGDEALLDLARSDGRVVVTLDKDFGELAVVRGKLHCGIVRLVDLSVSEQAPLARNALRIYATELVDGAIVTVERHRVRVRPGDAKH
jgi:predicted nuclease of predicted toxin-antitoxin system